MENQTGGAHHLAGAPAALAQLPQLFHLPSLAYNKLVIPDPFFNEIERRGKKQVHFIGIGGIGVSALARWFLAKNWAVTGSDLTGSDITAELEKEGIRLVLGHSRGLAGQAGLVIRSQAVPPTDPEYREAVSRQVPIFTYPEMIGALSRRYDTLAVVGAHGKSTTTALLALTAISGKLDPTVILGTKLKEFGGKNFRAGASRWLVLEADEYGRAFLNYSPAAAIVTNIDREHLDTYRGLPEVKRAFLEFMGRVRAGGTLVLNKEDRNINALKQKITKLAHRRRLKVFWYSTTGQLASKLKRILKISGRHNLSNAAAAYTLSRKFWGLPAGTVFRALGGFTGSWRRAEVKGAYKLGSVSYEVYDDYAHHPTEIKAALRAFREKFRNQLIICVFQPHQAERLKKLFADFKQSFGDADALLLFPEYRVAGREEKPSRYTAQALSTAIQKKYPRQAVGFMEQPQRFSRGDIRKLYLRTGTLKNKVIVIMMGAGNIVDYTPKLL